MVNRLAKEKSPYLLQHADNPVDWYPWGPEAFQKAARENKPIFLSIGYSTCHWCHVMAHESFQDSKVANLMNDTFVSIKVDREERPDIDMLYMSICQMMTGSGGWPLTIIMTPEKEPFFAGTYIPRETRFGRQGMLELVPSIKEIWETRKGEIMNSAGQITAVCKTPPCRNQAKTWMTQYCILLMNSLKKCLMRNMGDLAERQNSPRRITFFFCFGIGSGQVM